MLFILFYTHTHTPKKKLEWGLLHLLQMEHHTTIYSDGYEDSLWEWEYVT